jgi:heme/copper-type cytochrome/quinol oxidase subunit 3
VRGIQKGILFFILSEVCFFIAFFWGYFDRGFTPCYDILS